MGFSDLSPENTITGADGTVIGNDGDQLKTSDLPVRQKLDDLLTEMIEIKNKLIVAHILCDQNCILIDDDGHVLSTPAS